MKKIIALVLALCMVFALCACGSSSSTSSAPAASESAAEAEAEAVVKDSVIVALTDEPDYLSTCDHDSIMSTQMDMILFNGLTRIDMETLSPVCDLAESYTQDSDTEWTFVLKQGVKFHNGDDFTAADVAASIAYAQSFDRTASYTSAIAAVEAVDDYTVKITTSAATPNLLFDLAYHFNMILPHALIESGNDFSANPVGTGPYKFVKWTKGDSIVFEANADYFDADRTAKIANLTFSIIPEGSTRTMALESGEVDFVYSVASSDINRLMNTDGVEIEQLVSVENFFLYLNAVTGDFTDSNLRNAISYAINREDIVAGALNGFGTPSYSCVSTGYAESVDTNCFSYDLDKAKAYLEAWGGDPASVSLDIICSNDTKTAIATIMQSELAELGINVVVDPTDSATYQAAMSTTDLDAAIVSWSPANAMTYVSRFHSDRRGNTPAAVATEEMDALVEQLRVEMDADARTALIQEIIGLANAECWYVPIYLVNYYRAHSADLKNVVCSATGYVDFATMYWG